jgi:multidrug efflux system membrane fusion protein
MNDQDRPPRRLPLWPWVLTGLVIVLGVITYLTHRQTEAKAGGGRAGMSGTNAPPLMVSTATARQGDIGVYVTALGVVTPLNTVSVQSRVAGQIIKVNYQEGQLVHAGDLLIEIDPGPFQAAVVQAQGQLARDTALLEDARLNLERYKEAFASNAIPKQQYDTQIATVHQYEGTVQLDQGNLDSAKVQLAYCHITAPITGRVGLRLVDAGNIVQGSGSNALVIITQVQPITVIFNVAEDDLPQIQAPLRDGEELVVDVFDRTQQKQLASGTLETLDNQIDTTTGTLKLRAVFTNDDESLFPNQFVNVRLLVDTHEGVTLVPNPVIQRNADTAFVYLLDADQTVAVHPITTETTDGNVTEVGGLDVGAVVVADNFNRLTDGAKVTVRPAGGRGGKKDHPKSGNSDSGEKSEKSAP